MGSKKKPADNVEKKGRRRWRTALEVAVVIMVILGFRAWIARDLAQGDAPDFQALLLDGSQVTLSDYSEGPMVLHFWSTWCSVCRLEEGGITRLGRSQPVLTVAMRSGTTEDVRAHLNERERELAVVNDPNGKLAEAFGVRGVPSTFIIDRDGRIIFRKQGLAAPLELRLRLWFARRI